MVEDCIAKHLVTQRIAHNVVVNQKTPTRE
jgi:hypothetical protein